MNLSQYPSIIAIAYDEMERCDNIQLKFRALIKVFGVVLKYTALITISDYLRIRESDQKIPELDQLVKNHIERPSLGHWNNFLREILVIFRGDKKNQLFMPELFDFYYKDTGGKKLKRQKSVGLIDKFIFIRNKYVHPDIYPSEKEVEEVYLQSKADLDTLLDKLSFFVSYPLVRSVNGCIEKCRGLTKLHKKNDANKISFFISKPLNENDETLLDLGSFVYDHLDNHDDKSKVLLYEALIGKRIKYILGNNYVILEGQKEVKDQKEGPKQCAWDPVQQINELLARLVADLNLGLENQVEGLVENLKSNATQGNFQWHQFQNLCEKVSSTVYNFFIHENKFDNSLYIERPQIDHHIAQFLDSDKNTLIIVAESGLGKTNVFCRWYLRLKDKGHSVLFFYGRTYDGTDIDTMIMDQLHFNIYTPEVLNDFDSLIALLEASSEVQNEQKKLVIIFDAINEYAQPEELMGKLVQFSESYCHPGIKIIFSIRTFVWEHIEGKYLFDQDVYYHSRENSEIEIPYVPLLPFNEDELKEAYTGYRNEYNIQTDYEDLSLVNRKILSNPLLLLFTTQAYEGQSIPKSIFTSKIFEQYSKERVNQKDMWFLKYLCEAMWRVRSDAFSFAHLTDNDKSPFVKALAAPPKTQTPTPSMQRLSLADKLGEYVFGDPVYEATILPMCLQINCKAYKIHLPVELLSDDETDLKCNRCGLPLGQDILPWQSTYYRLKHENIIQEHIAPVSINDLSDHKSGADSHDYFIRFTYDRMFEYLIGRYIHEHEMNVFGNEGFPVFARTVAQVQNNYIFWGGIKNVLVAFLRNPGIENELWYKVAAQEDKTSDKNFLSESTEVTHDNATAYACQQIFSNALEEFYHENSSIVEEIMLYISASPRATERTMQIALEISMNILAETKEFSIESSLVEVIRRGLLFPNDRVRFHAARVALALFKLNQVVILGLLEKLQQDIAQHITITSLPKLISRRIRNRFVNLVDSYLTMNILILGAHFDNKEVRETVYRIGGKIVNQLKPFISVLSVGKNVLAGIGASFLAKVYWRKGPFPCDYIQMHLSLNLGHEKITERIGDFFAGNLSQLEIIDVLNELITINNGLITWYLYSLLPIYAQRPGQAHTLLQWFGEHYDTTTQTGQYTMVQALWILTEFSSVGDLFLPLLEECAEKFIRQYGGSVLYETRFPYDRKVAQYIEENSNGAKIHYWAEYDNGQLKNRYDNSILKLYSEVLIRKRKLSRLDYIIDILVSPEWKENTQFLAYCIDNLGDIGVRFPEPVLKTLQYIIENLVEYDQKGVFEGVETTLEEILRQSLLKIKSFHPQQVNYFVETLEHPHYGRLRQVITTQTEIKSGAMFSYYGELLYQKNFLTYNTVCEVFGRAIKRAGKTKSVEKHFQAFVLEFLEWLKNIEINT